MSAPKKQITVAAGAFAPPLAEQLEAQGVFIEPGQLAHFQRDSDAIMRLYARGYLNESGWRRTMKHLMKLIGGAHR